MQRRSLLLGLGAILAAPAIVRAESLMRVVPRDDTAYLQGLLDRGLPIIGGTYTTRGTLVMRDGSVINGATVRSSAPYGILVPEGLGTWAIWNSTVDMSRSGGAVMYAPDMRFPRDRA